MANKKISSRVGEQRKMYNGQHATIITYRSSTDMDIQFEDGYVAQHVEYSRFCDGHIANKNLAISQYHASKYIGETKVAKCGLHMTIIAYRNSKDIDVQFEDGVIVSHTSYYAFAHGGISHPHISKGKYMKKRQAYKHRIGETCNNNDGEKMFIHNYRNSRDIDVLFEDGSIVEHRKYEEFKTGMIKNPNKERTTHIGEKYVCNNGQVATITNYESYKNVTVSFEDGYVKDHVRISELKNGSVANPRFGSKSDRLKSERIGAKKKMQCGLLGEVVGYDGVRHITVRFPNGETRKTDWRSFERGTVKPKGAPDVRLSKNKKRRIGCVSIASNGMKMEIVDYNNVTDIKVMFENGEIVEHVTWDCFLRGSVSCPNISNRHNVSLNEYVLLYYLKPYGFIHYSDRRKKMEIDIFNPDLSIGIEYDGQIFHGQNRLNKDEAKNKICEEQGIHLYRIREPNCPAIGGNVIKRSKSHVFCNEYTDIINHLIDVLNTQHNLAIHADVDVVRDKELISRAYAKEFSIIGEESENKKKEKMVIVNYRHHKDIDIQFEDGTIVYNKSYHAFKNGEVKNPNYYKNTRTGLRKCMNSGLYAKISEYRSSQDIDVIFDDGMKVYNRKYADFALGRIEHPQITSQRIQGSRQRGKMAKVRIGQTSINKHGDLMTIVQYRRATDIDVEFENGVIRSNVTYNDFKRGTLTQHQIA